MGLDVTLDNKGGPTKPIPIILYSFSACFLFIFVLWKSNYIRRRTRATDSPVYVFFSLVLFLKSLAATFDANMWFDCIAGGGKCKTLSYVLSTVTWCLFQVTLYGFLLVTAHGLYVTVTRFAVADRRSVYYTLIALTFSIGAYKLINSFFVFAVLMLYMVTLANIYAGFVRNVRALARSVTHVRANIMHEETLPEGQRTPGSIETLNSRLEHLLLRERAFRKMQYYVSSYVYASIVMYVLISVTNHYIVEVVLVEAINLFLIFGYTRVFWKAPHGCPNVAMGPEELPVDFTLLTAPTAVDDPLGINDLLRRFAGESDFARGPHGSANGPGAFDPPAGPIIVVENPPSYDAKGEFYANISVAVPILDDDDGVGDGTAGDGDSRNCSGGSSGNSRVFINAEASSATAGRPYLVDGDGIVNHGPVLLADVESPNHVAIPESQFSEGRGLLFSSSSVADANEAPSDSRFLRDVELTALSTNPSSNSSSIGFRLPFRSTSHHNHHHHHHHSTGSRSADGNPEDTELNSSLISNEDSDSQHLLGR